MDIRSLALFLPLVLAGCGADPVAEEDCPPGTTEQQQGTTGPTQSPIPEGFLRTDGVYRSTLGQLVYFIRFFPEGRAMLIGGLADGQQDLREALEPSTITGGTSIVHNVPITLRGDSIFFVTPAMKGDIDYFGMRHSADSVAFRKYSHVTGNQVVAGYRFEEYALPVPQAQEVPSAPEQ